MENKKILKLSPEGKAIEEKIKTLQKELQMHQMRLNNAQQVVNIETREIIAKSGAIEVLEELKAKPEVPKPDKKEEKK